MAVAYEEAMAATPMHLELLRPSKQPKLPLHDVLDSLTACSFRAFPSNSALLTACFVSAVSFG